MTTTQDCSVGIGVESTFGTGVTPTRWLEFVDESLDWTKVVVQGKGLRVGARMARSARRAFIAAEAKGDMTVECVSKGMGLLWRACLGSSTSTLVSGSTYQQVHTFADVLPSLTVQKGLPRIDGTVDAYTLTGGTVDKWTFDLKNNDIATLKVGFDGRDLTTATAYAAPSYASGGNLLHFGGAALYSGALTAPTATALGSAPTSLTGVRSFSVEVSNEVQAGRFNAGGAGRKAQQLVGERKVSGTIEIEYDAATYRDLVLNDGALTLVANLTGGSLSSGSETLQVILPDIRFDGELPKANGTELIVQSMRFTALENASGQNLWVVARTSDTAL